MKENKEKWTLSLRLLKEVEEIPEKAELLWIEDLGRKAVTLSKKEGKICVELRTDANEEPLVLETVISTDAKEFELFWLGYRVELWMDGVLRDEEWPDGECITSEKADLCCIQELLQAEWTPSVTIRESRCEVITDIQYWAPELGNHNVGDCMPFAEEGTYHLFYLKDRHQHKSKWGKGAHQFAHISTRDLMHWQEHPVAVEITHQWEGSICTGSVIRAEDLYYAFYAVRMTDGSSAKVSFATSKDCVHFTKSEQYFTLTAPYETTSVRDPEVFKGADGSYHMFLTTSLEGEGGPERNGCLAHLISNDLTSWEQQEPFMVPGYTDQPECSDYFEWNGWYYVIFSNYGTAKYRYSRQPFGPWICPENEMIDGLLYRVPKTAEWNGRRIAAGFLCINTEGNSYAGSLVLREIKQKPDGTLVTCFVEELLPDEQHPKELRSKESRLQTDGTQQNQLHQMVVLESTAAGGYREERLALRQEYIRLRVTTQSQTDSFGLTFRAPGIGAYEIRINPSQAVLGVFEAHSCLYYNPTKRVLSGLTGLGEGCVLEVILKKDVLDICINKERTLVCRLEEEWPESAVEWGCYVKDGSAEFEVLTG